MTGLANDPPLTRAADRGGAASNSLSLDNDGSTLTDEDQDTYTYDAWNRLVSFNATGSDPDSAYTYAVAIIAGKPQNEAYSLAYYSQLPDLDPRTDPKKNSLALTKNGPNYAGAGFNVCVLKWLHSLHGLRGDDLQKRRDKLEQMIKNPKLKPWQRGALIHAYGDAYAHTKIVNGVEEAFLLTHYPPGETPDQIGSNPQTYANYVDGLLRALGSDPNKLSPARKRLLSILKANAATLPKDCADEAKKMDKFVRENFGFKWRWFPGKELQLGIYRIKVDPIKKLPTQQELSDFLNYMRSELPE
jgi:hypothetical protein